MAAAPRRLSGKKGATCTKMCSWEENLRRLAYLDPQWYYCWNFEPPQEAVPAGKAQEQPPKNAKQRTVEFLPMFWGYYPEHFQSHLQRDIARHPLIILGFNEPDHTDQSNVPVLNALEALAILLEAVEQKSSNVILLVSPSCADPLGPWMMAFMQVVDKENLRVDVIGVHHYGSPSVDAFQTRMQRIYETYGRRPIIITEFGVADWQAKSVNENRFTAMQEYKFMEAVLPWTESQDWILGYNWFPFKITSPPGTCLALWDEHGQLTTVGTCYSSFRPTTSSESCAIS